MLFPIIIPVYFLMKKKKKKILAYPFRMFHGVVPFFEKDLLSNTSNPLYPQNLGILQEMKNLTVGGQLNRKYRLFGG